MPQRAICGAAGADEGTRLKYTGPAPLFRLKKSNVLTIIIHKTTKKRKEILKMDSVNCFSEKCKQTSPLIISRFSTQFIILHLSLYFYTFSFLCSTRYAYAIIPPVLIIDLIHENCFFSNPGIAFLNTSSFLLLFLFCTSCIN